MSLFDRGGKKDVDGDGENPPPEAIELVALELGPGIVIFHPDGQRMATEWIEWDGDRIEDIRDRA